MCRLGPKEPIPLWAEWGSFCSISRTPEELSIACEEALVPDGVKAEKGWRCLKVQGPLDFGQTGILASLAQPLAAAKISLFAVSTFDTDYLLVKQDRYEDALKELAREGHSVP